MKVLFASSEVYPFAMSGGLADVSGALPKALRRRLVGCRVVMPLYGCVSEELRTQQQENQTNIDNQKTVINEVKSDINTKENEITSQKSTISADESNISDIFICSPSNWIPSFHRMGSLYIVIQESRESNTSESHDACILLL